jgi:hypothetical protein
MKTTEVHAWAQDKPEALEFLDGLNKARIDWALFSGTVARPITSSDIDVLVSRSGFDAMCNLVPPNCISRDKLFTIQGEDDVMLQILTDEINCTVGNTEVQALRPATIYGSHGNNYFLSLSPVARDARREHRVSDVTIYEADPLETMLVKSIMQRGLCQGKFDCVDVATVAADYNWDSGYIQRRTWEAGYDARADNFLQQHAGRSALSQAVLMHA